MEIQGTDKASEVLFTIFRATLAEYGIKLFDLAGGTTDSGSDVKTMCVNILLRSHNIPWDWCVCHLADKAAENAFGTSADPQKSKNKDARDVIKLVTKAAAKVNQSTTFKQKTAYEMLRSLVGSEMCIRDRENGEEDFACFVRTLNLQRRGVVLHLTRESRE